MRWGGAALCLVLGACGGEGPVADVEPAWPGGAEWTIEPEPLLRLGATAGDRDDLFQRVIDAALLPDGRIAVADLGLATVLVFDTAGALSARLGRRGQGPGEFTAVRSVSPYRGDSIAVYDGAHARVSVFRPDGAFARSVQLPRPLGPAGPLFLTDGTFLVAGSRRLPVPAAGPREPGRMGVDSVRARMVGPTGEVLHTWPALPYHTWGVGERGLPTRTFLVPRASFGTDGRRVFWGWPERFEVVVLTREGAPLDTVGLPGAPVDAPADARERFIEAAVAGGLPRETMLEDVYGARIPAFATQPIHPLRADATGRLWVPSWEWGGIAPPTRWSVFDTSGMWLGDVAGLPTVRLLDIGEDRVLGLAQDELGVQYVQVHRIVRPDGGD